MTAKNKPLPKSRRLTVGYHYYESQHKNPERCYRPRQVPTLRLCGDWLQAAGLMVGQKAHVKITKRGLTITPEE